jgi:phospholipid/cholesterol/gamma-HCH transport system substrate-binding protein
MTTAAKVGAFLLVVMALAGFLILKIQDIHLGAPKARTVTVRFKDVQGLDNKSTVRVAGVRVGKVSSIRLIGGSAVVTIELTEDVDLRQGATATIASLGLLGEKYIELIPGPIGAGPLPNNSELVGNAPASFDQLTRLAQNTLQDIQGITSNLNRSLGGPEGQERIDEIVDNVVRITQDLRKMVETNQANVNATTANFRAFSESMKTLVDRLDRLVAQNTENVDASLANVRAISDKLQHTADNLNAITDKINEGKGTIGQLINNDETGKNLNGALVAVKEGVNSLNKTLTRVNKLKVDLGFRTEYLSAFSQSKSYFTLDLIPSPNKFYRLEAATQPFGKRSLTTTVVTTIFPDGHSETTTIQKEKFDDAIAISAELGWRFRDLVLRGGLIESRGGVGADYMLLHDRLRFSAEAFDFNRQGYSAHAKVYGRFYFSPSVYVTAGYDDFLNRNQKADSVFFGGGIRWTDDDIKLLLSSIPVR